MVQYSPLTPSQIRALDNAVPRECWDSVVLRSRSEFLPFEEARAYVRSLGLTGRIQWRKLSANGRPANIPSNPNLAYPKEWKGYRDWFGTSAPCFLPFEKAREFVRSLNLKGGREWRRWKKSISRPPNIPSAPEDFYTEWKDLRDWLGRDFLPFEEARAFVRKLGLRNTEEWVAWRKSEHRPAYIPSAPNIRYEEWKGLKDWLGADYLPFAEARAIAHSLQLSASSEWHEWWKRTRPVNIPFCPHAFYKEWKDWGDWLNSGCVATWKREYLPFEAARAYVRTLRLKSSAEWKKWSKNGRPPHVPAEPNAVYKKSWKSWPDWLGRL
jgi:hypothetical protein